MIEMQPQLAIALMMVAEIIEIYAKKSFTSFSLAVIFITTASSFSILFVITKLLLSMTDFTSSN